MFDVYVEGATGASRGAVRELADAMAARYGVPAADVHARLTRGRFRVKSDVDGATAEVYRRDLESIGARVRIEPAASAASGSRAGMEAASRSMRSSPPPQAESRPGMLSLPPPLGARATASSLPPQPESRPTSSVLPPQPESRPASSVLPPQPESRPATSSLPPPLGARTTRTSLPQPGARPAPPSPAPPFAGPGSSQPDHTTLGALDRSGLLSLATLDDEPATGSSSDGMMPASMGPAAPRPPQAARSRLEPIDPFAPPEASAAEPLLDLADDELAYRARKRANTPPGVGEVAPSPGDAGRRSTASLPPETASPRRREPPLPPDLEARRASPSKSPDAALRPAMPAAANGAASAAGAANAGAAWPASAGSSSAASWPRQGGAARGSASSRARFAAGVAIAIVLGFVPAHFVAAWRERAELGAIDDKVAAAQSAADAPDSYAALDAFRAEQLDAKRAARRTIAMIALVVWAATGGALAYGWSRLPWQRPE